MVLLLMFLMILIMLHLNINKIVTGQTENNETKDGKIIAPLKYLSKFWRTL